MKLNERQIEFISKMFANECAGANSIARKLLTNGKCVVAGRSKIWYGGIGNFITDKPAEDAVDCTELTLDLDCFLSSQWFKNAAENELLQLQDARNKLQDALNELQNQTTVIAELIKK